MSSPSHTASVSEKPVRKADLIEGFITGLAAIHAFTDAAPQLTPSDLATTLGISRAAARRYLITLAHAGYAATDGKTYWLTPKVLALGRSYTGSARLPRTARPYPNWRRVNTRDGGGESDYHDLTFQLRGQVRSSLNYTATYKWAHATSNIEIVTQTAFSDEINARTNNRFDPEYTRGKAAGIPDHRATVTLIWDLPFLKENAVFGGWTVSSIITAQTGAHLTAYYSSHCGSGTNCYHPEKADAVAGQDPNNGPKTTDQWFNVGAFTDRAFFDAAGRPIFAGRWGNAEKGGIAGPGLYAIDLGLFKDFKLHGDMAARVQVQAQNVTNHPNLGNPNHTYLTFR